MFRLLAAMAVVTLGMSAPPSDAAAGATTATSTKQPAPGSDPAVGKEPGESFRDCADCPEMVILPPGSFMMGSPTDEDSRQESEGPQRKVTISRAFAVGRFEVTFDDWELCLKAGGCLGHSPDDNGWGRGKRPVIGVGEVDAQAYVKWLSAHTGRTYRLLSEAEWEYAARAGTTTPFSFGKRISPEQANYDASATYGGGVAGRGRGMTVPVGSFPPNRFGLHDMHGNVWEWTSDCWNDRFTGAPTDGSAWREGYCGYPVLRGGSWIDNPIMLRSAARNWLNPENRSFVDGFRVARTL